MESKVLASAKPRKRVFSLIYSDSDDELFCDSDSPQSYQGESSSDEEEVSKPSIPIFSSSWARKGDLKDITFSKSNTFTGRPDGVNPIDYFNFFFEESFLEKICDDTNKQAERVFLAECTKPSSRITSWNELTVAELKVFLGLLFQMGTISLNRLHDYWRKDRLFSLTIFGEQMSRNRFLLIFRCLYFTSDTESEDPLVKVSEVVNYFNQKMNSCYYPGKELCLDDCMILRRGRLLMRQFFKAKEYKYGIKLFMLTEPDGLILKFKVELGSLYTEVPTQGHAGAVVMDLLREKLNNGHSVFMAKYYNSIPLATKLLKQKTYCTGLLRKGHSDNPQEVIGAKLKEKENISRFNEYVHVGKWKDNCRKMTYITTEFPNRIISIPTKLGLKAYKPEAIANYESNMTFVNRQEKLLTFYPFERKTIRWHLKVAIHIFQLLLINSYKIYRKYSGNRKTNWYDYRLSVIEALLPVKPVRTQPVPKVLPGHKICRITEKTNGRIKRKLCRQCHKKKKRRDTIWHCPGCPKQPGLCVECFGPYHAEL